MTDNNFEKLLKSLVDPKPKTTPFGFAVKLLAMSTILMAFVVAFAFTAKLLYWVLMW